MAACRGLQHIFEKPLPESPTLLESLSPWKQIKSVKTNIEDSPYTEIFGELHFKESHHHVESASSSPLPQSSPSSTVSSSLSFFSEIHPQSGIDGLDKEKTESPNKNDAGKGPPAGYCPRKQYRHSDSFSSMNSESLSLCTEGLGFESSDDVEDLRNEASFDFQNQEEKTQGFSRHAQSESSWKESKRSRTSKGGIFPPPISCIGRTGKPWVCFKSYREDGRFILQEIRIPTQEFLHACREDGRLRLQFIQSDDEILEEEEEEEEEEDDDDVVEEIEDAEDEETKGGDNEDDQERRVTNEENRGDDAEKDVQISTTSASESS